MTGALRSGVRTTRSPLSSGNRSTGYFVAGILDLRAATRPTLARRHPRHRRPPVSGRRHRCPAPDGGGPGPPIGDAKPTDQVGIAENTGARRPGSWFGLDAARSLPPVFLPTK